MPVEVTIKFTCTECKRDLTSRCTPKHGRRGRRWFVIKDAYEIETYGMRDGTITVKAGATMYESDLDDEPIYCSRKCVLAGFEKLLRKLKP